MVLWTTAHTISLKNDFYNPHCRLKFFFYSTVMKGKIFSGDSVHCKNQFSGRYSEHSAFVTAKHRKIEATKATTRLLLINKIKILWKKVVKFRNNSISRKFLWPNSMLFSVTSSTALDSTTKKRVIES